jgi:uncharacterized protein YqeY
MSILEDLNRQIIEKYKSGDEKTRVFMQTLKAALINKQKESGNDLTKEDENKVLQIELKQRREALTQYVSANRSDLVDKIQFEIKMLESLLPEQISEFEVEIQVKRVIATIEDKSFPSVMKEAMSHLKGKADGAIVAKIVKQNL